VDLNFEIANVGLNHIIEQSGIGLQAEGRNPGASADSYARPRFQSFFEGVSESAIPIYDVWFEHSAASEVCRDVLPVAILSASSKWFLRDFITPRSLDTGRQTKKSTKVAALPVLNGSKT